MSVNVVSISKNKISKVDGMNQSIITVYFEEDVNRYVARLNGVDHNTGDIVHDGEFAKAFEEVQIIIDWNELSTEGENKINIYGLSANGIWTDELIAVSSTYGRKQYGTGKYGKGWVYGIYKKIKP